MKQILAFYQGNCSEQDVLAAAGVGKESQRNQFCYAHLYLGLYAEANGDMGKPSTIFQAAGPYAMNHYMGELRTFTLEYVAGCYQLNETEICLLGEQVRVELYPMLTRAPFRWMLLCH